MGQFTEKIRERLNSYITSKNEGFTMREIIDTCLSEGMGPEHLSKEEERLKISISVETIISEYYSRRQIENLDCSPIVNTWQEETEFVENAGDDEAFWEDLHNVKWKLTHPIT